ncbi:MAG: cob(I)yrinic acid a,c-diamide adenosyltransferase [Candidatus Omnitrophica bacterium]|nr:cob(I)yrinic acid a,c-diamide adenosyltransferase [Candidatus Omnitrophota bacterium]
MEKGLTMQKTKIEDVKGLILVFTGEGKGKTTAAMGTALRMVRHGKRVGMVQFFKTGTSATKASADRRDSACLPARQGLGTRFKTWSFGGGFTWSTSRKENAKTVQKAWKKCRELLTDPKYGLVILDEIHIALKYKFLKSSEVIPTLKKRPALQHVILTGRGAPQAIIRVADLVTEMKCIKHSFKKGILAQPGIEF